MNSSQSNGNGRLDCQSSASAARVERVHAYSSVKAAVLTAAVASASLGIAFAAATPARAACLTTNAENNCATYDDTSATTATVFFVDSKLTLGTRVQVSVDDPAWANYMSNWQYSTDNITYNPYTPGINPTDGYGQINTITTANPFYIKVDLSSTAPLNTPFGFTFYSNSTGNTIGGVVLNTNTTNNGVQLNRTFTRVAAPTPAAPGPLPLMGAAAAFGYSRKIRKAIKATA